MGLFNPSKQEILNKITETIHPITIDIVEIIGESKARELFDSNSCEVFQFYVGAARKTWENLFGETLTSPEKYDGLFDLIESILNRGRMDRCYKINSVYEELGWHYQNSKSLKFLEDLLSDTGFLKSKTDAPNFEVELSDKTNFTFQNIAIITFLIVLLFAMFTN